MSLSCSHTGARVFHLCLKIARVELCQKLATLYNRVVVGIELLNLSRNLAADLNRHNRLHDPCRTNEFAERTRLHRCGEILWRRGLLPSHGEGTNGHDE